MKISTKTVLIHQIYSPTTIPQKSPCQFRETPLFHFIRTKTQQSAYALFILSQTIFHLSKKKFIHFYIQNIFIILSSVTTSTPTTMVQAIIIFHLYYAKSYPIIFPAFNITVKTATSVILLKSYHVTPLLKTHLQVPRFLDY